jgi:hypothetical protein
MEGMTEQQVIDRGAEAQRLLDNPLLAKALDDLERDVMEAWAANSVSDTQTALQLSMLIKTSRKFRDLFRLYVEGGRYTAEQMKRATKERESLMQRAGRRVFGA